MRRLLAARALAAFAVALPVAARAAPLTPPAAWHPAVLDVPAPGGAVKVKSSSMCSL